MKSFRTAVSFAAVMMVALCLAAHTFAQSAAPIYTWDHAYGEGAGNNVEGWGFAFGSNAVVLNNAIDGELTITETNQLDWAINDSFNRIREVTNPLDFGGLDLTGLDSIEIELSHNGGQTYGGQVYAQTPNAPSGCCDFDVLGGFSVPPGGPHVVSVPLSGLTADKLAWVRTIGIQMFDHSWDGGGGPLTWSIREVRSAGTELTERFLSPHDTIGDLDGAVVKFDETAVSGGVVDGQTGLSAVSNLEGGAALRWVDLAGGPGAAIAWGNGRDGVLAVDYHTRATDLSNYKYMEVRIRAQPGAGADPTVSVQMYLQRPIPGDEYNYVSLGDVNLPVDSQYHVLTLPLAGIANLNAVQWHGINLGSHAGNMAILVDYVKFRVPEPSSVALLALGLVAAIGRTRRGR